MQVQAQNRWGVGLNQGSSLAPGKLVEEKKSVHKYRQEVIRIVAHGISWGREG